MPLRYNTSEMHQQGWLDKIENTAGRLGDIFCNERLWEAVALIEIAIVLLVLASIAIWWTASALL